MFEAHNKVPCAKFVQRVSAGTLAAPRRAARQANQPHEPQGQACPENSQNLPHNEPRKERPEDELQTQNRRADERHKFPPNKDKYHKNKQHEDQPCRLV